MAKLKKQILENGFTQTPNYIINSQFLSFKAKGLWSYIWSKPDGWDFAIKRIEQQVKDGRDAVAAGVRELEDYGLLKRKRLKNGRMEYHIFYEPPVKNPETENPSKPRNGKPVRRKTRKTENPSSNKEIPISNKENKEIKKGDGEKSPAFPENILNICEDLFLKICAHDEISARKYLRADKKPNKEGKRKNEKWAKDVDLMIRKDRVTEEEIYFILTWVFGGKVTTSNGAVVELPAYETAKFNWYSNIKSGKKLREKFPVLFQQARDDIQRKQKPQNNASMAHAHETMARAAAVGL